MSVCRSDRDSVPVVDVSTAPGCGPVRVNLNDGNIWAGDPEGDVPEMLDRFTVRHTINGYELLNCRDCMRVVDVTGAYTLRAYVAEAKLHTSMCTGARE